MILGINSDDILNQHEKVLSAVSLMKTRPVLGVVCDPGIPASAYVAVAAKLASSMDLLWRPFDSASLTLHSRPRYTTNSYQHRAEDYCATLGRYCGKHGGIECGNEITLPVDFVGRSIGLQTRMAVMVAQAHQLNSHVCYFFDADDPHYMVWCAQRWNIPSTYATLSIYPNTYLSRDWTLDLAVNRLQYALPTPRKLIGEFGSEDGNGDDHVSWEEHLAMVRMMLEFRPKDPLAQYDVGGFEWDWVKWTAGEEELGYYAGLVL